VILFEEIEKVRDLEPEEVRFLLGHENTTNEKYIEIVKRRSPFDILAE